MAIYRAVGQNTYKFVTETNFTLSQDLTVPNRAFALPMVKYYTSSDTTIQYGVMLPGMTYSNSNNNISMSYSSSSWSNQCMAVSSITVDGETYYGTKSAMFYFTTNSYAYSSSTKTYYIKSMTHKVVMYQASSNTIITQEYTIAAKTLTESKPSSGTSYYYNYIYITIPKQTNDIILAVETIFPEE